MADDLVTLLERVWDVEVGADWLRHLAGAAARVLDLGEGLEAYEVAVGPWGAAGSGFVGWGGPSDDDVRLRFERWQRTTPSDLQDLIHRLVPCGLASRLPEALLGQRAGPLLSAMDRGDVFGVNGVDGSGRGVVLAAFAPTGVVVPAPSVAVWSRVASHLAAAARLWRRRAKPADDVEAVLEPDGRVVHAEGTARTTGAREALRALAVDLDRARAHARHDPEEALQLWRILAAGRWSLVDRFDRDGRRYVVARHNQAEVAARTPLSPREEEAVGLAALGHTDKHIAYELGLTRGTVARLLARARGKLGVRSRTELVAAWAARRGPA